MEVFKKRNFKKVVRRDGGIHLKNYIEFLKYCEASIRQCYSEIIEMDSDEFLTMMLVDGCFIIELLLRTYYMNFGDADHSILSATRLCNDIHQLNVFCKVPRHKRKATLKHDYFNSPWRTGFTSVAIVLLALTFIQTVVLS
ncbi:hypothetical protein LguiB_027698 [Lonicera macranthoides]